MIGTARRLERAVIDAERSQRGCLLAGEPAYLETYRTAARRPVAGRLRWPAVKVLFTTACARNAIVHHGRLDPGVHLVVKPFTQAALADKVRRVLDGAPP